MAVNTDDDNDFWFWIGMTFALTMLLLGSWDDSGFSCRIESRPSETNEEGENPGDINQREG